MRPDTIEVDSIDATELVFSPAGFGRDYRYILQPKTTTEDYLSTLKRFPACQIKRTMEYTIDDPGGKWYACFNVDCFDPPMAIVRARSFEGAYDVFCCEWERWLKVEQPDAADYPEDERQYNDNGTHIDTSGVQIVDLTLLSVSLEVRP